jgi:RNA polymerase sigma factor (sigma-70 family)
LREYFRRAGSRERSQPVLQNSRTPAQTAPMTSADTKRKLTDWFNQWRIPLRRFLAGKRGVRATDIDDVAQEVFLRLLRYERAELVENPQAYLFRMAANVAAEWATRARHTNPHEPKWLSGLIAEGEPEEKVARVVARHEIERALNTLTERQREVLELQYAEGLGHAEIAQRVGATKRSVKRMLAKSYERLRHELDAGLLEEMEGHRS